MSDPAQKEFCRELLAFKDSCGFTDSEFAGMLIGAGVTMAKEAGLNKGQIMAVVSKTYNMGPANDA